MTAPSSPDDGATAPLRIAAIDIGSNSIRQTIADVSRSGEIRIVDEMKAAPRLGEGLAATGRISDAAIRNALDALVRMSALGRGMSVQRTEAVATSAVRDASNRDEFLDAVRATTGLDVRILSGEEEALLSFRSALAHFDLARGRSVVMDIGGGSLELALSADGLLDGLVSLPFGAIRLTEDFLANPTRNSLREMRRVVRRGLRDAVSRRDWHNANVIGSGGTFTNLAAMILARQGLGGSGSVQGTVVSRAEVEHLFETLYEMPPAQRAAFPGLNPGRSDIIVAGLVVAAEVMARVEARELTVSAYGIREGLLLEAARITPVTADAGVARERSVVQLAERSHYEEPHARQVQRIALALFDALGTKLSLDAGDRRALADAALLHDIGYHINFDAHHKHSYHLIAHADLLGMSPVERAVVANVARYHRGALPKSTHRNFAVLDRPTRRRIRRLAAILRVADGLDRGHTGAVASVSAKLRRRALEITVRPSDGADVQLELWGASRKADLLERVLGRPVTLHSTPQPA